MSYSKFKKNIVYNLTKPFLFLFFLLTSSSLLANSVEQKFLDAGLVDVHSIDNSIRVDLVNSDPDKNFFEENFYDGLSKAYLRKEIVLKLSKAQVILKKEHPTYSLQVLDAARPRSVSRAMYEKMKGTRFERYVANPKKGSMHNYGIAVDITIIENGGNKLDMGPSPFYKSHVEIYWQYFLKKIGFEISAKQQKNRNLLKHVMIKAGFYPLSHEWWHFNGMRKTDVRNKYSIIE
jgi:zinc D-Ala-D-Ala dipeptidase